MFPSLPRLAAPSPSGVSAEQLQLFIPQLLSAIHVEALVIGNISKEVSFLLLCVVEFVFSPLCKELPSCGFTHARTVFLQESLRDVSLVEDMLGHYSGTKPLPASAISRLRTVQLPDGVCRVRELVFLYPSLSSLLQISLLLFLYLTHLPPFSPPSLL